jgi:hypothetical protein
MCLATANEQTNMNTDQITVHHQGQSLGPFTLAQINQKLLTGELLSGDLAWPQGAPNWVPLSSIPGISNAAPPPLPPPPPEGDATGGVIPYKNPKALTAYYLGVFSLIPCLGFFLGIGAIVLGILGLRACKQTPQIRGTVHAWIGIGLGSVVILGHLVAIVLIYLSAHHG